MVPWRRKGRPSSKRSQVSVWVPKTINGMAQESSSGCLSIPLSRASAPVAWRSWYLGFFFMASSACQGHKQHEEEFQMGIPKGWTWPCVPCVCHGSLAVEKGPGAEQEELENPRGSTWILPQRMKPESWQQIPGKICLPSWPAHKGRRASEVFGGRRNPWGGAASTAGWAQVLGLPFQIQHQFNPCLATAAGCKCSLWTHALGTGFHRAAKRSDRSQFLLAQATFLPKIPSPGHAASLELEKFGFMCCTWPAETLPVKWC